MLTGNDHGSSDSSELDTHVHAPAKRGLFVLYSVLPGGQCTYNLSTCWSSVSSTLHCAHKGPWNHNDTTHISWVCIQSSTVRGPQGQKANYWILLRYHRLVLLAYTSVHSYYSNLTCLPAFINWPCMQRLSACCRDAHMLECKIQEEDQRQSEMYA